MFHDRQIIRLERQGLTGAVQGLGFAIARGLGRAGATLVLNGRNPEKLERAVSALSKEGLTVHASLFDVRDGKLIHQKITEIERDIGPIRILVNNAAIQRIGPLETTEESVWRDVIESNLTSIFLTTKQVVQGMIQRRSGKRGEGWGEGDVHHQRAKILFQSSRI